MTRRAAFPCTMLFVTVGNGEFAPSRLKRSKALVSDRLCDPNRPFTAVFVMKPLEGLVPAPRCRCRGDRCLHQDQRCCFSFADRDAVAGRTSQS